MLTGPAENTRPRPGTARPKPSVAWPRPRHGAARPRPWASRQRPSAGWSPSNDRAGTPTGVQVKG